MQHLEPRTHHRGDRCSRAGARGLCRRPTRSARSRTDTATHRSCWGCRPAVCQWARSRRRAPWLRTPESRPSTSTSRRRSESRELGDVVGISHRCHDDVGPGVPQPLDQLRLPGIRRGVVAEHHGDVIVLGGGDGVVGDLLRSSPYFWRTPAIPSESVTTTPLKPISLRRTRSVRR